MKKVRWAIVGTGEVAGKFVIGLRSTPGAVVTLAASRSADRAAAFASQLGIPAAVGGYEKAAAADVDAVYIATPPSEHRENALMFIAAGKPVLIEKPFAANAQDAQAIITAARAAKVFCMEGMWTRFLPAMKLAQAIVADGRIGAPRSLFASFATATAVDPTSSLFRPELGGGALSHRGVYPISLAMHLLGPASLLSAALTRSESGVDEEVTALLRHAIGAVSTVYAGARTTADNGLTILGTEGTMRFLGPVYRPFGIEIAPAYPRRSGARKWDRAAIFRESPFAQVLRQRFDGGLSLFQRRLVLRAPYIGNGYCHEAIAMMEALAGGLTEHPLMPLDASLAIARLVDEIRAVGHDSAEFDRALS